MERPSKKHRVECPRPTTPTHRIMEDPPTCPANRRKPSRSQSVSTNSTEQCQPHELVFFDDEEDLLHMATEQQHCRSSLAMQFEEKGSAGCSSYDGPHNSRLGCGSSGVAEGVDSNSCLGAHHHASTEVWHPYPPRSETSSGATGMMCSPFTVGAPSPAAPGWPPNAPQSVDALQWQTDTAQFFRQIDERALRLAP